jgi:flagellin
MGLFINTNSAAISAAYNLSNSNDMLQKSLARLSSGSRIVSPADDAGGLAVSMKLSAAIKRTSAAGNNVADATSFLQVQDGALKTVGDILSRVSELKLLSTDVTKSASDIANYDTEFTALQAQLTSIEAQQFNGVNLFVAGGGTLSVVASEDGAQTIDISQSDLDGNITTITGAANLAALTVQDTTDALANVATSRAQNGAETSRLGFASQLLATNGQNLQAANSRIADVDVAQESTNYAKSSILVQFGTSMLAQANASAQNVLRLIQ